MSVDYVWSPEFNTMTRAKILADMPDREYTPRCRTPDENMPAYLKSLYSIPLLTKQQEIHQFRKFNYLRWRRSKACGSKKYDSEIKQIEEGLILANLRLAVNEAKRYSAWDEIFDKISTCNLAIINSVRKFDYMRGFKFSTYATSAMRGELTKEWRVTNRHASVWFQQPISDNPIEPYAPEEDSEGEIDFKIFKKDLKRLMSTLNKRHKYVIFHRFYLERTLEAIAEDLKVTKERVRQIQTAALERMRKQVSVDRATRRSIFGGRKSFC